jgi:cytochrome c peroxidase
MRVSTAIVAGAVLCLAAFAATARGQRPTPPPAAVEAPRANPLDLTDADLDAGRAAYAVHCAGCHGADGQASAAPTEAPHSALDLTGAALRARSDGAIFAVISGGVAGTGMPEFSALPETTRWQLVAWVRSRGGARLRVRATDGGAGYPWELPPGFPQPKVPADNLMTAAKVELGRFLFYDTRLSGDGTFSCGTCHEQRIAFTDGKARAVGHTGQVHPRGAMSLANVAYAPVLTWADPTMRRLEAQALVPMFGQDPVELGLAGREAELLARLKAEPRYPAMFVAAFPGEPSPTTVGNVTRAIAAFERTLLSGRSPYDLYRTSADPRAMSPAALRGEDLFFAGRTRCFRCHGGFAFTETVDFVGKGLPGIEFHNTGLYNLNASGAYPPPNTGVHAMTRQPGDMGRFKAPSLRNVALTAPYMHDGSIRTLIDVVRHYEAGGRTMSRGEHRGVGRNNVNKSEFVTGFTLTDEERGDLVAFLESLTDHAFISDRRFANPWPQK